MELTGDEVNVLIFCAFFVGLCLSIWLLGRVLSGAKLLLDWAADGGFVGVAAYIAMWVFLFPVMLIGSAFTGIFLAPRLR